MHNLAKWNFMWMCELQNCGYVLMAVNMKEVET